MSGFQRPRSALFAVFLVGFAACGESREPASTPASEAKQAPNDSAWPVDFELEGTPRYKRVVLVTIDTLRRDHVSSYGYFRPTTPCIDKLAAQGVVFDRAVAAISHTAPSHASMLTGLPPDVHGVLQNGQKLAPSARDLARLYHEAGFETAAFLAVKFLRGLSGSFAHVEVATPVGSTVMDAALRWLKGRIAQDRFFLWIHLYDPHCWKGEDKIPDADWKIVRSWGEPKEELVERWSRLHGLSAFGPGADFHLSWYDSEEEDERSDVESMDEYVGLIDAYDAQILHADAQVERLVRAMTDRSLLDSTLLVVTADHGEGLGSHGFAGHGGRIYQEQLLVPLVFFAGDGSLAPKRVGALVQLLDLFPTLAEAGGATVQGLDPLLHGASLWPLLRGENGWMERPVFSQRRHAGKGARPQRALFSVQTSRFKYITEIGRADEFFELERDPLELQNNALNPSSDRDSLKRLLEARIELRAKHLQGAPSESIPAEWLEELKSLGYVGDV